MAIAAAAVNNFRTVSKVVTTTVDEVYRAPIGYVGVFLMAQCVNISADTQQVSFYHNRVVSGIGTITTEIVKDFDIPTKDTANLLSGKLVLETDDFVTINANTNSTLKFLCSVIETSN